MPGRDEVVDRIRAAAERMAASHGLEIFDVHFRREPIGWVLRVIVDRVPASPDEEAADVGIDDCRLVSNDLSAKLDVDETLGDALGRTYTLEVSSPGLDRPLRGEADYRRFRGRLAKIVTREPVAGQSSFSGRLAGVEDGAVLMEQGRRTHRVPISLISRARLEVEFGV